MPTDAIRSVVGLFLEGLLDTTAMAARLSKIYHRGTETQRRCSHGDLKQAMPCK
jgi:hypothetical protein